MIELDAELEKEEILATPIKHSPLWWWKYIPSPMHHIL